MAERVANCDEFTPGSVQPASTNHAKEIRATFEKNVRTAEEILRNMTEQTALGSW
jgi:hypothetical protein